MELRMLQGQIIFVTFFSHPDGWHEVKEVGQEMVNLKLMSYFKYEIASYSDPAPAKDSSYVFMAQTGFQVFENNVIELMLGRKEGFRAQPASISEQFARNYEGLPASFKPYKRVIIRNNVVRQINYEPDTDHTVLSLQEAEMLLLENNIVEVEGTKYVDGNGSQPIRFRTTNFPAFFNNKKADGTLVRGYEGLLPDDPVQKVIPELSDTISDGATFGCL